MFKQKLPQQEQGFTLVEVLVAILITTIFVAVSMQAMVLATVFKVRAQESAEATTWIQEGLEEVKYTAANLQFSQSTLTADAVKDTSSITVSSASDFAVNDKLRVGLDTATYQITVKSGTTLTVTPKLGTTQLTNAAVVETTMCSPAARNVGLADALRDQVNPASDQNSSYDDSSTKTLRTFRTKKQFRMKITTTLSDTSPYNVLQLKYEVSPGTTFNLSKSIANFNIEMIPNVAFECPQ